MNLASPCGPPIKTNCDFFLEKESVSQRWRRASSDVKECWSGADHGKMRRFLDDSGHMQFLFISRCGGSMIRLPWRLPRYTLAYRPSNGKSASCLSLLLRLQRLYASSKSALAAVKFRCVYRGPRSSELFRKWWSLGTECDGTEILFLFLPHRFRARCLCRCAP